MRTNCVKMQRCTIYLKIGHGRYLRYLSDLVDTFLVKKLSLLGLNARNVQIFQKSQESPQNYRHQKSDMKQILY